MRLGEVDPRPGATEPWLRCAVCAQEHSAVRTLWRHQGRPTLIVLAAGLESIRLRRQAAWPRAVHAAQVARLADALANADLVVETDDLSSNGVLSVALAFLAGLESIDPLSSGGSTTPGDR